MGDIKVYLCNWHVKRAWLGNLLNKTTVNFQLRTLMFNRLAAILQDVPRDTSNVTAWVEGEVARFKADFANETQFIAYMDKQWIKDIGRWACVGAH